MHSDSEYSKAAVFRRLPYGGKPRPHTERDCFENVLFSGGGKLPLLLQRGGERKLAQRFIFFSLSLSRHRSVVRVALTLSCPSFTLHPLESTNSMAKYLFICSMPLFCFFFQSHIHSTRSTGCSVKLSHRRCPEKNTDVSPAPKNPNKKMTLMGCTHFRHLMTKMDFGCFSQDSEDIQPRVSKG